MNTKVLCNKALFVLRILLGVAMLYFGGMKIGAPDMMVNFVGSAGAKMGLGFLSVQTWFWIAVVGEILAGLLLLASGKWSKIGALLTLIIMVFAGNAIGWNLAMWQWTLTTLAALVVLFYGNGCWSDDPNCCDDNCNTGLNIGKVAGVGAMVGAGTQLLDSVKDKVGDVANLEGLKDKMNDLGDMVSVDGLTGLKDKATDMLGSAGGLVEGAKDMIANNDMLQGVKTKIGDMVETAQNHMETMGDKVEDLGDQAKDLITKADGVLPDSVSDKLNDIVDFVQDKAQDTQDMVASVADKVDDAVEVIDADSKKA